MKETFWQKVARVVFAYVPPEPPPRKPPEPPRTLTDDDVSTFITAAETPRTPRKADADGFIHYMHVTHPMRMARLERDFSWLQDQAARKGFQRDQVRWML